jgi:hypothetical protein
MYIYYPAPVREVHYKDGQVEHGSLQKRKKSKEKNLEKKSRGS